MEIPGIEWVIYAFIGGVSGFIGGLFGVGGGIVIVPVLLIVFDFKEYSPDVIVHMAVATSLAAIVLNTISAAYNQNKRQAVERCYWVIMPALVIGAIGGVIIADSVSGRLLRLILVCFLFSMGVYMLYKKEKEVITAHIPKKLSQALALFIGAFSAMVGIAGGTFLVPLLTAFGLPVRNAIGTSSFLGIPLVLIAAVSYVIIGYGNILTPSSTLGYVYIPAFVGIALISPWGAKLGVYFAHKLDPAILKKAFSGFLLISAANVLWKLF